MSQLDRLNKAMKREMPTTTKVDEVVLICTNDTAEFNRKSNACLKKKMLTFEPLGMWFDKKQGDIFLSQIFVSEKEKASLVPEEILPEKVIEGCFIKETDVDSFNEKVRECIADNFLMADPVRINKHPETGELIFTAYFIKTEKQLIKVEKTDLIN